MSPQIENLERMARDLPAMPVVAQKTMHMLGDPRTTNAMLGETLASDQALASRILQMANSPFFGTRQKIASISNAVFVLGHSALRSLIITVCTKGLFKNPGLMEEKIWEHALAAAVAARQIAEKLPPMDPDEAFLGALLHDVGKTSLVVVYHDDFRDVFTEAYNDDLTMEEAMELEKSEFGYTHCEIGALVLAKWRLPPLFARIARRHHATNAELLNKEQDPKAIAVAALANLIAQRLGMGRHEPDKRVDVIGSVYNEMLGVDRDAALQIIEKTLEVYKEARDQFDLK